MTEKNSFIEAECSVYRRLPKWRISCLWWTFIGWNEQSLWDIVHKLIRYFVRIEKHFALCPWLCCWESDYCLFFSDVLFFIHLVTVHGNSCLSPQKEQVKTMSSWGHQLFVLAFITVSLGLLLEWNVQVLEVLLFFLKEKKYFFYGLLKCCGLIPNFILMLSLRECEYSQSNPFLQQDELLLESQRNWEMSFPLCSCNQLLNWKLCTVWGAFQTFVCRTFMLCLPVHGFSHKAKPFSLFSPQQFIRVTWREWTTSS